MATTYAQLEKQIAALEAQAHSLRKSEADAAIAKVRELVARHELTAQDIFGAGRLAGSALSSTKGKVTATKASVVKYTDGAGKGWSGFGRKPGWLIAGLAAGKRLEDFAVAAPAAPARGRKPAAAPKAPSKVKYRDGNGNTWSGFGRKPGWLVSGLAAGKTLQDFMN